MRHFEILYNRKAKRLDILHNGRPYCGMVGQIAEDRYKALEKEIDKSNIYIKEASNGLKKKTPKV